MAEIETIDWTDDEYVAQYLDVYGEEFDAVVPHQLARIGDPTGMTFVDLGCGQGTLLIKAAAMANMCIGIDISPQMCELTRRKARAAGLLNVNVVCSSFLDWKIPSESIDIVWSRTAIHHLVDNEKDQLFRVVHKALRSGGRFFLDDLMFQFGYRDYEQQLPMIAKVLLEHVDKPDKRKIVEKDILSSLYKEYPSPTDVLKSQLESSGFKVVSANQQTPFYGEIEAKK